MKIKGVLLIAAGVIAEAFIISYDIILRKPENDFTGPISTPEYSSCGRSNQPLKKSRVNIHSECS
ncbi:MAG: hypothetical protein WC547_01790 [Candidatus Omnitrophota bacterium]